MMKSDTAEIALIVATYLGAVTLLCTVLGAWLIAVLHHGFIMFPIGGIAMTALFTAVAFIAEYRAGQ